MEAPVVVSAIPKQITNEQAAFGPFELKDFFSGTSLHFSAELSSGRGLPQGMICTSDGVLTGIPAKGTHGNYQIIVTIENEAGQLQTEFTFVVKPSLAAEQTGDYISQLKAQVWEALEKRLPIPDITTLYNQ